MFLSELKFRAYLMILPAVFSHLLRKVIVNAPNVYTFLDDVLIATPTLEEYFETLNE